MLIQHLIYTEVTTTTTACINFVNGTDAGLVNGALSVMLLVFNGEERETLLSLWIQDMCACADLNL